MKLRYLIILFLSTVVTKMQAQVDPHTSQYYMNPLTLNPAMTGNFDGDFRASAVFRDQWSSVGMPFKTYALSVDARTDKNINLGVNLIQQSAANGGYTFTNGYVSVAYTGVKFGDNASQHISLALQGGFVSRRINASLFSFGDQWTSGTGYSSTNPTADISIARSSSQFDAGAGILYYNAFSDKTSLFFGGSAFHITRVEDQFTSKASSAALPARYCLHGGVSFSLNDQVDMIPNFLYMSQGTASETSLGVYLKASLNENLALLGGLNYRVSDAIVPMLGMSYNKLTFGLSYDVNNSSLNKLVQSPDSFECSISFKTGKEKTNTDFLRCPSF